MNSKPRKATIRRPRLHLKCEQCGGDIVLHGGQAERYQDSYTVPLCERCAPALHKECGKFIFPSVRPKTPPVLQESGERDPARMTTAKKMAENIASMLWRSAAEGNEHSALMLTELTCLCVVHLQNLAENYPDLLRPTTRTMNVWPFFVSKQKRFQNIGKRLLDKLEVGTKPMLNLRLYEDSHAQIVAQLLLLWLDANSQKLRLPFLSTRTSRLWFEVGWRRVLTETQNRPDKHPYLASIGKSQLGDRRAIKRGLPEQTPAMQRSDVTAKIKGVVKNSFMTMLATFRPEDTPLKGGN